MLINFLIENVMVAYVYAWWIIAAVVMRDGFFLL